MNIEEIKREILDGKPLDERLALALAQMANKEELYELAHQVTCHFMGNKFDTCSIINAKSGNCGEDCKWCAQSGHYKTKAELRQRRSFIRFCQRRNVSAMRFITGSRE